MLKKRILNLGLTAFLLVISASLALGEEAIEQGGAIPQTKTEIDVQWLWGEVVNIDIEKNTLQVKYIDYEVDQEKQAAITVNPQTTYENVKSFTEIKPNDTLSIDYTVTEDGKNIAKNIVVEKADTLESVEETSIPITPTENTAP